MNSFTDKPPPAKTIAQVYSHLLKPPSTLLTLFTLWVAMTSMGYNSFLLSPQTAAIYEAFA